VHNRETSSERERERERKEEEGEERYVRGEASTDKYVCGKRTQVAPKK